jgi:hypothetical protein
MSCFDDDVNVDGLLKGTEDVFDGVFLVDSLLRPKFTTTNKTFERCSKHMLFLESVHCEACTGSNLMCLVCFTENHLGHVLHYHGKPLLDAMNQKSSDNNESSVHFDEVAHSPETSLLLPATTQANANIVAPHSNSYYAAFAFSNKERLSRHKLSLGIGRVMRYSHDSNQYVLQFFMKPDCIENPLDSQYRRGEDEIDICLVHKDDIVTMEISFDKSQLSLFYAFIIALLTVCFQLSSAPNSRHAGC